MLPNWEKSYMQQQFRGRNQPNYHFNQYQQQAFRDEEPIEINDRNNDHERSFLPEIPNYNRPPYQDVTRNYNVRSYSKSPLQRPNNINSSHNFYPSYIDNRNPTARDRVSPLPFNRNSNAPTGRLSAAIHREDPSLAGTPEPLHSSINNRISRNRRFSGQRPYAEPAGFDDELPLKPISNPPRQPSKAPARPYGSLLTEIAGHVSESNPKKDYAQHLLEQMKDKEGKRAQEKRKEIEAERKLLSEKSFFDNFGRTRGRFYNRYRVKPENIADKEDESPSMQRSLHKTPTRQMNISRSRANNNSQSPNFVQLQPLNLDFGEEKNIKKPPVYSYNSNKSPVPDYDRSSTRKFAGNLAAKGRSMQESEEEELIKFQKSDGYDLQDPSGEDDSPAQRFDTRESNIDRMAEEMRFDLDARRQEINKINIPVRESHRQESLKRVNSIRQRAYENAPNERKKEDIVGMASQVALNYIQKLEYQKTLDHQVLEKQLKRQSDTKVRLLEEKIEELEQSREKMIKELEMKAAQPQLQLQPNPTLNNAVSTKIIDSDSDTEKKPPKNTLRRYHFSTKKFAPPQHIPNIMPSRKNLNIQEPESQNLLGADISKKVLPSNSEMVNMPTEYGNSLDVMQYLQWQQEAVKIRDELRDHNRKFQDQLYDMRTQIYLERLNQATSPTAKLQEYHVHYMKDIIPENLANTRTILNNKSGVDANGGLKNSDSKISLLNETRFVPIIPGPKSDRKPERSLLDDLLVITNNLERSMSTQNTQIRKEIEALRVQLCDLAQGNGKKSDYDTLQSRLNDVEKQIETATEENMKMIRIPKIRRLKKKLRGLKRAERETDEEPPSSPSKLQNSKTIYNFDKN